MSCQIPTSTLEDALFKAYRTNFQKYKNLSSVIQSVIDQQIAPEAKIHAIWFYSGFINSAAFDIEELQTPEWNKGIYSSIHDYLKPVLTGEQEFDYNKIIEKVNEFFPKEAPAPIAAKADIESKIKIEPIHQEILNLLPDYSNVKISLENDRGGLGYVGDFKQREEDNSKNTRVSTTIKYSGIPSSEIYTHELLHYFTIPALILYQQGNRSENIKQYVEALDKLYTKAKSKGYTSINGVSVHDNLNEFAVNITNEKSIEQLKKLGIYDDLINLTKNYLNSLQSSLIVSTDAKADAALGAAPAAAIELNESAPKTLEQKIESDIADIPSVADVNIAQHVNDLIQTIVSNKSILDAYTAGSEASLVMNYLNQVKAALAGRNDSPSKVTLINSVDTMMKSIGESLEEGAKYEDLANADGITKDAGNDIFEYRRADGTKFEAVYKSGTGESRVFTYYAPGSEIHGQVIEARPGDQKVFIYKKDNVARIDKENGKIRITEQELLTGLILGDQSEMNAEGKLVRDQMAEEMAVDQRFYNQIRITAGMANAEFNLNRLNRIREAFPSIARILETMELPSQRNMLKAGEGPILTFVRRTSDFTVTISNWQGSKSFELMPIGDLAFVYPDNTVEELDVNNSEHMDRIKEMIQVRDNKEFDISTEIVQRYRANEFTDIEVEKFKNAVNTYKAFQMEVRNAMSQSGNVKNLDIRNIFIKYYDISNSIRRVNFIEGRNEPETTLGNFIDANEGRLTVRMQSFDESGNATGEIREALMPIVMKKTKGNWEVVNTLPTNRKLIGDNGKIYGTVEAYLLDNNIDLANYAKNFNNHQALYIGFKLTNDVLTPYAKPLIYKQNVNTSTDMVDMAATLRNAFSKAKIEQGNREMLNLNEKGWGFDLVDGVAIKFAILEQRGDKKVFGIKFEMLEREGRTQEQIDRFNKYAESNMNIILDQKVLSKMFDAVDKLMQSKNMSITSDMNTETVSQKAAEVGSMTDIQNPLMQDLFEAYGEFVDSLSIKFDEVVNKYEAARERGRVSEGLLSENFINYALFDGSVLKIKKRGLKDDIRTNYFTIKTNDTREINISLRNTAKKIVMPAVRPKGPAKGVNYDSASPVEEVNHKTDAVDPSTVKPSPINLENFDPNDLDSENKIGFSLVDTLESYIALSDEEFSAEIQAMKELMPSAFQFIRRDFNDLDVDGHALGYIEDMMINLNNALKAKGVVYHEGFHGVFRKLLSSAQQAFYLKKAGQILGDYKTDSKGKYIQVGDKKVYAAEFRKARRYGNLSDEQVRNLIYEEYLADSFANYMETNQVPKTWMEKLFAYLKRLLNMFKKGGRIDNLFYDISIGKFKDAPILEGMNDVTKVYSMDYKGIPYLAFDSNGQIGYDNQVIPSYIVSELRDMMIYRMAEAKMENPDLKFNQLYNVARAKVLENYKIENLVAKNPDARESIMEDYSFHYNTSRWLLGALNDGETFTFLNYTKHSELNNKVITGTNKVQLQISDFNAKKFRNHLIEEFSEIYKDSTFDDIDDIETELQQDEDEQESGNQFADVGFANKAPYEGSSYFRKLFKYIPYEHVDHKNGITRTRMVDSKMIFSTIRKLTANLEKNQIVPAILDEMSRLDSEIRNYYDNIEPLLGEMQAGVPDDIAQMIELRDSLYGVFNTLSETVGITPEGYSTKNSHILNMFQDVFNTVDAHLLQVQLRTIIGYDQETKKLKTEEQRYAADDIVIASDMHKIRTDMNERLATLTLEKADIESSIQVLKRVNTVFGDKRNLMQEFFTEQGLFNDAAFDSFVNRVYAAVSKFNLNIPRQLIYTSLGFNAFQLAGNNLGIFVQGSRLRSTLKLNKPLLKSIGQLAPSFWGSQLTRIVEVAAKRTEKERQNIAITGLGMDTETRRFVTAYVNSAGEFLVKYNPTIGGSMTRDANGNLVHKYVKPTPAYMAVMKLQSVVDPVTGEIDIEQGLRVLAEDYLDNQLDFLLDNALLNSRTNPQLSKDFLRELEVSAFAGFSQSFDVFSNRKEGDTSTFKSIDEKAYILSMFGLFTRMREVKFSNDPTKSFSMFKRILTQYEATSTSIVVDGVFKNYFEDSGKAVKDKGVTRYVNDLMNVLRQEYELIRRNFKEVGKEGVKRYDGYNVNPNDRGYTFNILADMFGITEQDQSLVDSSIIQNRDLLTEAAKQDKSFDALISDPENKLALVEMIEDYASVQYERFENYLKEIGIDETDAPTTGSFEQFKGNFFFNNWINSIFVNQLFDGPIAIGISNFANYFKRQKAGAAAGSNIYSPNRSAYGNVKTYRASVLKDFVMYLDNNDRTKPLSLVPYDSPGNVKVKPFDGQSVGTLDRRIRIADAAGTLDSESLQIMNRMRFETRSSREYREGIQKLRDRGIVFNSIKSVTAGFQYIKQSEHTLIRKELSMLRPGIEYATAMVELENLYSLADFYAMELEGKGDIMDPETGKTTSELYKETIRQAHSYFRPAIKGPLGGFLHNLLNSMEYHRIEQLYDTNASKRATVAPLDFDVVDSARPDQYLNLEDSLENIPNELTYIQVETSKIANKVTSGIQQKLLLISQLDPTDPLYKEIKNEIDEYQNGLADVVSSQTKRMMRMFNTTDKNVLAKLYGSIAAGLREQGNDATILQYFEVNRNNEPVNPPSMPMLANILTYYYFSLFNKNIFDKKVEGRKYYHISPILTPVMEMDGKIVKRSEYKKNPKKYENATSRFLTLTSEEVEMKNPKTGKMEKITKYTAEVIVPKELQKFKQEFVEKYLNEFFATRIPTEDKRSMFVAKIVDYMDEAYGNSIAVPTQIHMLAGSDFDIDALYAYMKSSYTAVDGTLTLYGDYEHYKTKYGMEEKEAKFIEYLTSMSKDQLIGDMVKEEMRKIKNETDYRREQAYAFGELFGGKIQEYFSNNASVLEESENIDNEDKIDTFRRLIATFNVLGRLENSNLPTTPDALKVYMYETKSNPVVEITLNKILDAKNKILSNKNVYARFFADPNIGADAAVAPYETLVRRKGLTERDIYNKQNIYTPTALAVARSLNSESKDSLGIAASFNKGLSMLSTINATFNKNISNNFYIPTTDSEGRTVLTQVETNKIVNDSVQLVGGLIGLFADAPKTPYPGPLHLNSLTTPVLAAMLASGIPQNAAIMFQSIPIIKNLVNKYNREYASTYSRTQTKRRMSFAKFLEKETGAMFEKNILEKYGFEGGDMESFYKIVYDDTTISKDDPKDVANNTVPLSNYGFKVVNNEGMQLPKEAEDLLMLSQYNMFVQLANEISFKVTTLTDPLKALRPDFDRFDRLLNTYENAIKGKTTFISKKSMTDLFVTYPVLRQNYEALKHMSDVSRMIFMDRTSMLKGFVGLFDNVWGYEKKDIRKDLGAFIGMQLQRSMMEENPKGLLPNIYMEQLDPENFLGGQVIADYHDLLTRFPNNSFLNSLKVVTVGNKSKGYRVLEMTTSRLGSSGREAAFADLQFLLGMGDPVVKEKAFRIAYHGMIKAGGQRSIGGYYDILPSLLSRPMAQELWKLQSKLSELDRYMLKNYKKTLNDDGTESMSPEAKTKYMSMINEILSDSFGGKKLGDMITEALSKIISVRLDSNPDSFYTRVLNYEKEKVNPSEVLSFFQSIAPNNAGYIVEEVTSEDKTTVRAPRIKGGISPKLKEGTLDLFTPDMEGDLTIDLIGIKDIMEANDELSNKYKKMLNAFGIYGSVERGFVFPLFVMNSRNQMMILTSIDEKSMGEGFISTLAETEFGTNNPIIELRGSSAQYKVVESQGTSKISPMAFNTKEGMQIHNMVIGSTQSMSLEKLQDLPARMIVKYDKNRMYEILKSEKSFGNYKEKTFARMDGSTITTGKRMNRYDFIDGQLMKHPDAGKIGELVRPESYDRFADALGYPSWESLTKSPIFGDFMNGQSYIFVYELLNGDVTSPTSDPIQSRPDGITIEDMDNQIDEERKNCN
jgi:hypothetical protein